MSEKIKIKTKETEIEYEDAFKLYTEISDKGNNISLLMESRSLNLQYGRESLIVPNPALRVTGRNEMFRVEALTDSGKKIISFFSKDDFPYADDYKQEEGLIEGVVKKVEDKNVDEEQRSKLQNISFVLRTIMDKMESDSPYAGFYGAFAYDFARNFYSIGSRFENGDSNDFVLFIPTTIYLFDDIKQKAKKVEFEFNGIKDDESAYTRGFDFVKQEESLEYDMTDDEYTDHVKKIINDIRKGRVMQCVLSMRMQASLQRPPFESYTELRDVNPSPYSFYYNLGDNEVLYGASPEMHIKITDGEVEIRPIAGTISRSKNPLDDAKARVALLTDEKEIREHTMLVDLARHELYHLSEPDSVYVSDLFTLENYPNLYHLVSGVKGRLKKGINAVDALLVTLPAGTLSGAPKLEAMKMIEEYEGSKRIFYGGTIGMVGFNGGCNTGITIRSVHVKEGSSFLRAGAGIVALSTPEGELNEVKLKMAKSLSVLGVKQ